MNPALATAFATLLGSCLAAESARPAAPNPPAPPRPAEPSPAPEAPALPEFPRLYPEGAIGPEPEHKPCVARLELSARRESGRMRIEATLTSNSDEPVELALRHPCPGGPVSFVGFGQDFDYYGTCVMGACREAESITQLTVPAKGQTLTVASLSWPETGDGCRRALPFGTYDLNAWAELAAPEGSVVCGLAHVRLEIPAPARPAPQTPPAPRVQCPPMPACGLGCDGPFAKDENGCTLCACEPDPWGTRPPQRPGRPKQPQLGR